MAGIGDRRRASEDGSKAGSYRAKNLELFSREITASASSKIYSRDADNLYPLRIEKVINNSPTGRRCANLMAKYIAGKGNAVNYPIGKGKYINDIIKASANCISKQYGVYFKVKYDINVDRTAAEEGLRFKTAYTEVLDYVIMAKSKEDDAENAGKFYAIEDNDEGGLLGSDDSPKKWFYPFNQDPKIIAYQMRRDCKAKGIADPTIDELIKNYRGQVFYLNLTPEYIYALPLADSVYNDLDTESRIALYNNTQSRTGFLGKTVVIKYEDADGADADEDFEEEIESWLGAENSSSAFVVSVPQTVNADLDKAFMVTQLKPQFDDKLFESTKKSIRESIMGAFNNIPEPLVFSGAGSLFGQSGETYREMKKFYWEQNEFERSQLEQTLRLFGYAVDFVPIVDENIKTD